MTFYQIKEPTLTAVQKAGLAADQIDKLKAVKQLFSLRCDFRDELAETLAKQRLPGTKI